MKSLYDELPTVEIAGRKFVGRVLFSLLVLVSALVGATAGLLLVYTTDLPQVEALENYRPSSITELYDDRGRVIGSGGQTELAQPGGLRPGRLRPVRH